MLMTTIVLGIVVALIVLTLLFQFLRNFKVVGANQVAVAAGQGKNGYRTYHGGRVVIWPVINKRYNLDLRPTTTSVKVVAAIAKGMSPLDVTATVSFALSSSGEVLDNAIRRLLTTAQDPDEMTRIASSIVEGHLRDSVATMTPEQVMRDKAKLTNSMIRVCKSDLAAIGIEITTMNIADVEDHRLEGMEKGDLYIGLLNRVQSANALSQARCAQAEANANAREQSEARRGEVECRKRDNERESLQTRTSAELAEHQKRKSVGVERSMRDGEANTAGTRAQIEAEKERINYLTAQYEAEIVTPAHGKSEHMRLEAQQQAARVKGVVDAEITQLARTVHTIDTHGKAGLTAYLTDNFDAILKPFAQTLELFPADKITILSGSSQHHAPISAVDPHPIEAERARLIRESFGVAGAAAQNEPLADEAREATTGQTADAPVADGSTTSFVQYPAITQATVAPSLDLDPDLDGSNAS